MTNLPRGAAHVRTWRDGPAGYVQLDRPEKANAYTAAMLDAIREGVARFAANSDVRAIVICAAGSRAFSGGADLGEIGGRGWRAALGLKSAEVFTAVSRLRLVTVAAVNGAAAGGGLELALSCDLRIAAQNARFWFPEPQLGLIPAAGGTQRLAQVVGKARAKELILGGAVWDAADALRFGLVSEVVAAEALLPAAQVWAERVAARNPLALQLAKEAIDASDGQGAGHVLERVAQALLYELRREENQSEDCKDNKP